MKYLIILLLSLYSGFVSAQNVTSLDPTQVYNTNNIVNIGTTPTSTTSTWQNLGLVNQGLPCWAPEDGFKGAYCGPLPYYNQGSFNFSYGLTDVYQIANIAAALPNLGTGLRVNGYNYSFTAKNGNGWDNGQIDYLSAYVNFYGSDGKSVRYDYYDLTYKFDWSNFNFSKTFDTPYASKDLSTVQYGFVGGDSNGWAGPYGPEIINVSFSLKYSVDPCYTNVLYSPTCPGYLEALNKLTATTPIEPTATTQPSMNEPISVSSTTETSKSTASTSIVQVPILTNQQPNIVSSSSVETKVTSSTNTGPSLSTVLSMIKSNQAKEQSIAQNAVNQANQVAQMAITETEKIALSVATTSSIQSTEIANESIFKIEIKKDNKITTSNSILDLFALPTTNSLNVNNILMPQNKVTQQTTLPTNQLGLPINQSIIVVGKENVPSSLYSLVPMQSNNFSTTPYVSIKPEANVQSNSQQLQETASMVSLKPPVELSLSIQTTNQVTQEIITSQQTKPMVNLSSTQHVEVSNTSNSLFAKRGDPLSDYIEQNNILVAMVQPEMKTSTVKTNVQDNELAGGVRIERIAVNPAGFNVYTTTVLKDIAFYAPKEIYRNQKTIDNTRALRQLSSDKLHQEMVEQQYRR
jgi:hypothetical protein